MTDAEGNLRAGEEAGRTGRIGIFPSWGWLYGAVILYTVALIVLLQIFTTAVDFGAP